MKSPGFIREGEFLAKHSTLGIGGPSDFFARIKTEGELLEASEFARDEEFEVFVLGCGTNVLFSDKGFRGLVLKMGPRKMYFLSNDTKELSVEAGALVSTIVGLEAEAGFSGFENFAGLPGTVGGAIYGNAGCFGTEVWEKIISVRYFAGENFSELKPEDFLFPFSYRSSLFKDHPSWVIISARLKIEEADPKQVAKRVKEVAGQRAERQPEAKNIGCIFKNPLRDGERVSAGELIDCVGLKGKRIGNAEISSIHANFFVNLGGAKASDFVELIKLAKGRVFEKFQIVLGEEIVTVGEF